MANLDIRVYPLKENPEQPNNTKAFASVSIEDLIAIRGIRVVEGSKGLFVTMPQSKDQDGQYHDIAFPLNGDLRKEISKAIIDEYKEVTKDLDKSADKTAEKTTDEKSTQKKSTDDPQL